MSIYGKERFKFIKIFLKELIRSFLIYYIDLFISFMLGRRYGKVVGIYGYVLYLSICFWVVS